MDFQSHIFNFKKKYGEGELKVNSEGRVELPLWLAAMLLHLSGVRSKKSRIQKKVILRELTKLLDKHSG